MSAGAVRRKVDMKPVPPWIAPSSSAPAPWVTGDDAQEPGLVGLAINQLRQLHYQGYLAYENPYHEVVNGLMLETPDNYRAHRRTQNQ